MSAPTVANVADGEAHVGIQAQTVHFDFYYQLPPDAPPEATFRIGVRYLDARVPGKARELIEDAVARGYDNDKVQFHRLLALLSGRTLRQLGNDDYTNLTFICNRLLLADANEWTQGLRCILRLLNSLATADPDLVVKELDELRLRQRTLILDHLGVLLEGHLEDQIWHRSIELARAGQPAQDRSDRIWKFFHPSPAPPRVRPVQPASITAADWLGASLGAAAVVFAVGNIGRLLLQHGRPLPVLAYLVCAVGLVLSITTAADWHFRREQLRRKDAQFIPPRQHSRRTPADGFARKVDRLFNHYFGRYVPSNTDRSYWLSQTAGIRRHLRNELVEIYREERIEADRIAWLIRYLVGDVRQQWQNGTLTVHREELRTPLRTRALCVLGLTAATAGSLVAAPAAILTAPTSGTACVLLAAPSIAIAARAWLHISTQRRRVKADEMEHSQQRIARLEAFERWRQKLSNKPSDAEMAAWLECDRRILVDDAIRHYRLRPSQVVAHAFIEAPAPSYKRARVDRGPWRYSRYRLLLFLLTDDGVRQIDLDLDFEKCLSQKTQRLNYRFDAVAAVRIDGVATSQQTFELTLINGTPIRVQVTESNAEDGQPVDDAGILSQVTLDSSGLPHTLNVLEGIAAEGKEWIRHQRHRADERLSDLTANVRSLIE